MKWIIEHCLHCCSYDKILRSLAVPDNLRHPKQHHKTDHNIHGPAQPNNLKTPNQSCKIPYSCDNSTHNRWKPEEPKELFATFRHFFRAGDTINRRGSMPTPSLFHIFHREFRRQTTLVVLQATSGPGQPAVKEAKRE